MLDGGGISFEFPPQMDINASGDASIVNDVVQLTKSKVKGSFGWAYSSMAIPLWDNLNPSQVLATFSTHFQFTITRLDNPSGDGLAFFLAPLAFQSSDATSGEWLGLFPPDTDGDPNNQIFAVEFDDRMNEPYDHDSNHLGIDVNSIVSKVTVAELQR